MKIYNIWMSGFMIQGMDSPSKASYEGSASGDTFQEACENLMRQKNRLSLYNPKQNSYWGCGLYETEHDARKSFG